MVHRQNILIHNVLRLNIQGQNILGTKHPEGQNILRTKCPVGKNVLKDKTSCEKMSFCNINIVKSNMFYVEIIIFLSGRLTKVAPIDLKFSVLVPLNNYKYYILYIYFLSRTVKKLLTI